MNSLTEKQFLRLAGAVLLISAVWIAISAGLPGGTANPGIPAPQAGFQAPDFTLNTLDGSTITLSELHGQAVLVNVWASWCIPCRTEMPAMQAIYDQYASQGFTILAVNATSQDSASDAADFVNEYGFTFPILMDVDGAVSRLYQVSALPSSFFILPNGQIEEVVFGGPMAEALLRTRVERLLQGEE